MMMMMRRRMMMMIVIVMMKGECDNGLGNDSDPGRQGERPKKANSQKKSWIILDILGFFGKFF